MLELFSRPPVRLISEDLESAIGRRPPYHWYRQPAPLPISAAVASSLLQKAIRRGRLDFALQAASRLLSLEPSRLWRELVGVAAADVGLGDLNGLGLAAAALSGRKRRNQAGGDWPTACLIVSALTAAPKCRAADDMRRVLATSDFAEGRAAMKSLALADLMRIVLSGEPAMERALALRAALTDDGRICDRQARRRVGQSLFSALRQAGSPTSLVEVARQCFLRTGSIAAPLLLILSQEANQPAEIAADEKPVEAMIGPVPAWAYDSETREGREALALFLRSDARAAYWIRKRVPARRRLFRLGECLFRVEGSLVANRLRWPLGDWLRAEADEAVMEGAGEGDLPRLLQDDIARLNQFRALAAGSAGKA
jgi:hypothetical protein